MNELVNLRNKVVRRAIWGAFIIYLATVGVLCFAPTLPLVIPASEPVPYIYLGKAPFIYLPFAELTHLDFYLNIVMTLPFGVFIALLRQKKWSSLKVIGTGLAVGATIELTQLILDNLELTSRWIDVNDILANAAGLCLGYLIVAWLQIKISKQK
ncbi:hypothetical protein LPAF129_08000 [Ligilactobacillus pabuli]|uniref:VanZ-like domain-containing protein n=1 Tax=Ligilactobacillus pabuli TaxID=2886039 RepID=A0ABQ5JJ63_9LACO|nr:hypothetical protein LPAF129_08000 [Ligilactobacillus pabuli]